MTGPQRHYTLLFLSLVAVAPGALGVRRSLGRNLFKRGPIADNRLIKISDDPFSYSEQFRLIERQGSDEAGASGGTDPLASGGKDTGGAKATRGATYGRSRIGASTATPFQTEEQRQEEEDRLKDLAASNQYLGWLAETNEEILKTPTAVALRLLKVKIKEEATEKDKQTLVAATIKSAETRSIEENRQRGLQHALNAVLAEYQGGTPLITLHNVRESTTNENLFQRVQVELRGIIGRGPYSAIFKATVRNMAAHSVLGREVAIKISFVEGIPKRNPAHIEFDLDAAKFPIEKEGAIIRSLTGSAPISSRELMKEHRLCGALFTAKLSPSNEAIPISYKDLIIYTVVQINDIFVGDLHDAYDAAFSLQTLPLPPLSTRLYVARQMVLATAHLHSVELVHRDIKLENIFVSLSGDICLGDLGSVHISGIASPDDIVYTRRYADPDLAQAILRKTKNIVSPRMDSWSLGIALFLILTGDWSFYGYDYDGRFIKNISKLPDRMKRGLTGEVGWPQKYVETSDIPDVWKEVLVLMMNPFRSLRPTVLEILSFYGPRLLVGS